MTLLKPSRLQTFLVLGRVSNLPTVWSNCLAGWWLAGGGPWSRLLCLSLSVSLMYIGGMFLNDAFDASFDRNHRQTRPIPSGQINELEVWLWGFAWLILGFAGLTSLGKTCGIVGAFLTFSILVYNAIHKFVVIAPVVMGLCRFFVYVTAASAGATGVAGEAVWKGLALAGYVIGLSCLARKETAPVQMQYWPAVLLAIPVAMGMLFDDGPGQKAAFFCSILLIAWVIWTLMQTYGREHPNVGRAVARLLAGIALVDLLAVPDFSHFAMILFPIYFFLALTLQRFIPAT